MVVPLENSARLGLFGARPAAGTDWPRANLFTRAIFSRRGVAREMDAPYTTCRPADDVIGSMCQIWRAAPLQAFIGSRDNIGEKWPFTPTGRSGLRRDTFHPVPGMFAYRLSNWAPVSKCQLEACSSVFNAGGDFRQ